MAKRKEKAKSRTVTVRVVGAIPKPLGARAVWVVRMSAPYLPFYLDSSSSWATKDQADAVAERWKRKTVQITVTGE